MLPISYLRGRPLSLHLGCLLFRKPRFPVLPALPGAEDAPLAAAGPRSPAPEKPAGQVWPPQCHQELCPAAT